MSGARSANSSLDDLLSLLLCSRDRDVLRYGLEVFSERLVRCREVRDG
jgi:hypothetical protein